MWTLNDGQVERINEFDDYRMCDLHNDQVQLLVKDIDSLAIYDLRQRKELHRVNIKFFLRCLFVHCTLIAIGAYCGHDAWYT